MPLSFAAADSGTLTLTPLTEDALSNWRDAQDDATRAWIDAAGFTGALGQALLLPGASGPAGALIGYGSAETRRRARFHLAAGAAKLPKGTYALDPEPAALTGDALAVELLGLLLSGYRFDRYRSRTDDTPRFVAPDGVDAARIESVARSEALTRDLINTPAADMGPPDLEAAAKHLADEFGASVDVTCGDDLIERNFPMIHAVGRAADRAPRLIDLRWGTGGPRLTLVGKGVCFDTGGLNIKPGSSMGLMKKDMGGSAAVLGLARMIMASGLPLRLRLLIPAVENSIAGNAFRPQDILTSRKGLTVEINNTDAEGRLVLADALTLADEEKPDLIVSMATLTGAARVAVGPDLAPYYTDDAAASRSLEDAAARVADPVWRMPFHDPYEKMIEPGIADLDNAPSGGMAGSITAALFLRRFAEPVRYSHFDIYGWNAKAKPGRPKGGVGMGARALLEALPDLLGL